MITNISRSGRRVRRVCPMDLLRQRLEKSFCAAYPRCRPSRFGREVDRRSPPGRAISGAAASCARPGAIARLMRLSRSARAGATTMKPASRSDRAAGRALLSDAGAERPAAPFALIEAARSTPWSQRDLLGRTPSRSTLRHRGLRRGDTRRATVARRCCRRCRVRRCPEHIVVDVVVIGDGCRMARRCRRSRR